MMLDHIMDEGLSYQYVWPEAACENSDFAKWSSTFLKMSIRTNLKGPRCHALSSISTESSCHSNSGCSIWGSRGPSCQADSSDLI